MTPLAQAVRLVDSEKPHFYSTHSRNEPVRPEPLGSHIDQLIFSPDHSIDPISLLSMRKGGIDESRGHSPVHQRIHLILHQGNEGAHNHCDTLKAKSWKLIAERLSSSCGHYHQTIPQTQNLLHDSGLTIKKLLKTERLTQRLFREVEHEARLHCQHSMINPKRRPNPPSSCHSEVLPNIFPLVHTRTSWEHHSL